MCGMLQRGHSGDDHTFRAQLCPVSFLVVGEMSVGFVVVMSYVNCGDDG